MTSFSKKIAIVGTVKPVSFGDLLQYYVAVKLTDNLISKANITFMCPGIRDLTSVFGDLKLDARLVSVSLTGASLLRYYLDGTVLRSIDRSTSDDYAPSIEGKDSPNPRAHASAFFETAKSVSRKSLDSYAFGKIIGSSIARSMFSFDSCVIGGHTICHDPYYYVVQYEVLRSLVKGPIVTMPISIAEISTKGQGHKTLLKRLRLSLQKLDFICVRGMNSLKILRDELCIDERRIALALDSGFGMKLLHPSMIKSRVLKGAALRIFIVPRKDYFEIYNRWDLYKSYLVALTGLILWLFKNFATEIYLINQTIPGGLTQDPSGIGDLVGLLKKNTRFDSRDLKHLKIVRPTDIFDAYRLYASADLVISSYLHGGIMSLSSNVPTIFIQPSTEIKVLDILSFLGLDTDCFLIDMSDPKALRTENFVSRVGGIIENIESYEKIVESAVARRLSSVELPITTLTKLLG